MKTVLCLNIGFSSVISFSLLSHFTAAEFHKKRIFVFYFEISIISSIFIFFFRVKYNWDILVNLPSYSLLFFWFIYSVSLKNFFYMKYEEIEETLLKEKNVDGDCTFLFQFFGSWTLKVPLSCLFEWVSIESLLGKVVEDFRKMNKLFCIW